MYCFECSVASEIEVKAKKRSKIVKELFYDAKTRSRYCDVR